ncbi:hypothetical protein ACFE04_007492 [Oxalis oulophora]
MEENRKTPNKSPKKDETTKSPTGEKTSGVFQRAAELKRQSSLQSREGPSQSGGVRMNCLCSPTTHAGSFRCRHHRRVGGGMIRGGSVGSNLSMLGATSQDLTDQEENESFVYENRNKSSIHQMITTSISTTKPILVPDRRSTPFQSLHATNDHVKFSVTCPAPQFALKLSLLHSTRNASLLCSAALDAKCDATSGQTATITQKSPTITQAPVHEKSPQLDDGGSGFPPRDDGDGGGGGGGGGGNWSGGFFLFGFLAFLGFLKDKESEEDFRDR